MSRLLVPLVFLGLLAPSVPAASGGSEPGEDAERCAARVAGRVQAYYEGVQDLSARFRQTTQSVTLGTGSAGRMEAAGRVVFAKPGRMRWAYETPEESLVVSDGETLWLYDPGAGEAQRMRVTGDFLSGAAIQFLLGEGDLAREFEISSPDCRETLADDGTPPRVSLELVPREPAHYERLHLVVDAASGQVAETTVLDLFGNRTRVELLGVEIDRHPKPDVFRFEPPEGVDVIDLSAERPASSQ